MIEQADISYGTEIPKSAVNDLIRKTEEIIRIKQICRNELPILCNSQINGMLTENLQSITHQKYQKPTISHQVGLKTISQTDNLTPFSVKNQKSDHKVFAGRLSFDASSTRKSSAFKSRRQQYTASTSNRKKDHNFSRTYEGSFLQQRPWTQTECRKHNPRPSQISAKENYIKLKQQFLFDSYDEENKRIQLSEKRKKQQGEQQKIHQAFLRMSYQKRLMKQELENAKIVQQKPSSLKKQKQTIEIVNYQLDNNGSVLTNKYRKPFRKTIENIINLKYVDKSQDRIFKRVLKKQSQIQNPKRKKSEFQRQQKFHKNSLMNQAYNNSGNRQVSFIPYVTISPGVSLSQSSIKATILRSRPVQETTRQKFLSTIQNRAFRSYSKDYAPNKNTIQSQIMTVDVCDNNRASKTSLNNETKDSLRKSILWAAKTSRESHKIKLQKQDLLKQLVE